MYLYYLNLILVFVFGTSLFQFCQFALLTVVKLEVLVALDSNSRAGKSLSKQNLWCHFPCPPSTGSCGCSQLLPPLCCATAHPAQGTALQQGHHSSSRTKCYLGTGGSLTPGLPEKPCRECTAAFHGTAFPRGKINIK